MFDAPPEVTSTLIYSGPGAGPLLAAASAWTALAEQLSHSAVGVDTIASALPWSGPSSVQMRSTVGQYTGWLRQAAANAQTTAHAASAAAQAYQAAHGAVVDPTTVYANIATRRTLTALNVLGQFTATIATLEAHYMAMWAQNTTAMNAYSTTSHAATASLPAQPAPSGWNIFAPGSQSDATGIAGLLNSLTSQTSAFGNLLDSNFFNSITNTFASGFAPTGIVQDVTGFGFLTAFLAQQSQVQDIITKAAPPVVNIGPGVLGRAPETPPVKASVGVSGSVGGMRVPPSWAAAAPQATTASPTVVSAGGRTTGPSMIPLPMANLNSIKSHEVDARQPRYGDEPKVMPKHPFGG